MIGAGNVCETTTGSVSCVLDQWHTIGIQEVGNIARLKAALRQICHNRSFIMNPMRSELHSSHGLKIKPRYIS